MKFEDIEKETILLAFLVVAGIGMVINFGLTLGREKARSDELDAIAKSKTYTVVQGDKKYDHLKIRYNTVTNGYFLNNEGKEVTFKGSYVIIEE